MLTREYPGSISNNQERSETLVKVNDFTANPAPLGLMAFGMTTVLLNLHNAGLFSLGTMVLAMGIFYGGIAQVIAGIMEWKKGNTFGTVAFTSFGMFWLTLVALLVMPDMGWSVAPETSAMVAYLSLWGLFTAMMFVGALKLNRGLQVIFGTLATLFFLLAIADATGSILIRRIAGYEGLICGFSAIYLSLAQIWNELYARTVVPIGAVAKTKDFAPGE